MQRGAEGHAAAQYTSPDDTPCNSHRSSYLRDYTYSEDRPHSAGVRPRLLNKVANAAHATQRDDSDDENETWVLEGWKDEEPTVLLNACQSAKLPSKYTRNTPCPLPTNVRRVASAATSRPKPPVHKQPAHGQRPRAAGAPDSAGLLSKPAGVRPRGATLNRSPKPPLGQNLEVGDESDVEPSPMVGLKSDPMRLRAASSSSHHGPPTCTLGTTNTGTHPASTSNCPANASMRPARASTHPASATTEAAVAARAESSRGRGAQVSGGAAGVTPTVVDALPVGDVPSQSAAPLPLARAESSGGPRARMGMEEHAPHSDTSCMRDPLLERSNLASGPRPEPVGAIAHGPSTEHKSSSSTFSSTPHRAPEHQGGSMSAAHLRTPEWVTPTKRQSLPSLPSLHASGSSDGQPHLVQHQLPHLQVFMQPEGSKVQHDDQQSPLSRQPNHQQPQHLQQHQNPHPQPHLQHRHHHGLQPVRLYARSAAAAMATQQPQWQSNRLKSADAILPTSHHGYGPQTASLAACLSLSPTRAQHTVGEHRSSQESLPSPGRARISLQPLTTRLSAPHSSPLQQHHQHPPGHHPPPHHYQHHHHQHHLSHGQQHQQQPELLQQAPDLQHQQHLPQHDHLALGGGDPALGAFPRHCNGTELDGGSPALGTIASPRGADVLVPGAGLHRRPLPPPKPPPLPPSPTSLKTAEVLLQHMRTKYGSEGGHVAAARELQPKALGPSLSPRDGLVGKGIVAHGAPALQHSRGSDPSGINPPAAAQMGRSPSLPSPNKGAGSGGLGQGLKDLMLTGQSVGGGVGKRGGHSLDEPRGHGRGS